MNIFSYHDHGSAHASDAPAPLPLPQRGALSEVYAFHDAHTVATTGITLALALHCAARRPVLWARHEFLNRDAGYLCGEGLDAFGFRPQQLALVRAKDVLGALQAGLEGARCASLGAVIIELRGEARAYDGVASRRLALAARTSGTPVFLARSAAKPQPSAAETRWHVSAAPSRPLAANAPGRPAFSLTLLRHRGGASTGAWHVEWNRDNQCLEDVRLWQHTVPATLSRPVVSLSAGRAPATADTRQAG